MGEQLGDDRDPLLVRPFVLPDGDRQDPPWSASTWPVEQRAGEMPTQLLPTIPDVLAVEPVPEAGRRRRTLLLIGAGAVAVATVAGYAVLRPGERQETWVAVPGQALPAAVGPATSASIAPSLLPGDDEGRGSAPDGGGEVIRPAPVPRTSSTSEGAETGGASASPSTGSPTGSSIKTPVLPAAPIDLEPSPIVTGSGPLVTGNGLCLDLRGGGAPGGRNVHIGNCNGTGSQRWQLNSNRTLEVLGICAYLVGDGTVEMVGCDGRTTAQWRLLNDGTLTNMANGLCLTDPFSGARPGTAVIVAVCTGGSNQRWTFR